MNFSDRKRAEISEATFGDAERLAASNRMILANPANGCYQLRHLVKGWIINIYPRRNGLSGRIYQDPNHRGPFLDLPDNWTILDAVDAAIEAETT